MKTSAMLFALITCCGGAGVWADGPFDGSWQMNPAKSNLAGETMTFEDAGNGSLEYTDSSESYTFKPDGSTFTTPFGIERTFKKESDGSITTSNKKGGMLLNTSTWKISADGNTIIVESKGTKPNGDAFDNLSTYTRTAPGAGLMGGWKSTKVKLRSPNTLTIQTSGPDDLSHQVGLPRQVGWQGLSRDRPDGSRGNHSGPHQDRRRHLQTCREAQWQDDSDHQLSRARGRDDNACEGRQRRGWRAFQ